MLGLLSSTMKTATRQERWDDTSYWAEIERRRATFGDQARRQKRRWFTRIGRL